MAKLSIQVAKGKYFNVAIVFRNNMSFLKTVGKTQQSVLRSAAAQVVTGDSFSIGDGTR